MPIQEINNSFIQLLNHNGPHYLTSIGNSIHLHTSMIHPSLENATEENETLEIHQIKAHFKKMQDKYKKRQMNLIEKTNQCQSLTQDEEEWLDGQGNLVKEILLLEKIKSLNIKQP